MLQDISKYLEYSCKQEYVEMIREKSSALSHN